MTLMCKAMLDNVLKRRYEETVIYSPNAERDLNVVFISDTHGLHEKLKLPDDIDLLVHAGDFTETGLQKSEYAAFAEWFAEQKAKHKIVISGNRDVFMDPEKAEKCSKGAISSKDAISFRNDFLKTFESAGVKYLEDSGTTIEGLKIYGTPWTRKHSDNGFQIDEEQLQKKFANIPSNLDILISHSPPYGILDADAKNKKCGSPSLTKIVSETKPRIHVFGHIHDGYGTSDEVKLDETYFINAAMQRSSREKTREVNVPVILQIKIKSKKY